MHTTRSAALEARARLWAGPACPKWVRKDVQLVAQGHEVDQVVPLHVPWNLRVGKASENRKKGSEFPLNSP